MKKLFFLATILVASVAASAQNIQVHYDFGRNIYSDAEGGRQNITLTFEKFSADALGSWFYFVDLDINQHGSAGAYTEVSREFNIGNKGFAAHIEYDGGLNLGGSFQTSALIGPAWNGHNADFSTTYSVQLLYKQFFGQGDKTAYSSAQLTGVWSTTFAQGKCTFSGFADIWSEKAWWGKRHLVFLTEPQLWYNLNSKVSVGTEIEMSGNFIYSDESGKNDKFYINPTIAVKFNL